MSHKARIERPVVLSIAGFDPSSGAGLTADIKTIESHQCYGLSVCAALTVQNDVQFDAVHWTPLKLILEQLEILLQRFDINIVKIGLIENPDVLLELIQRLKQYNPDIKIIWDPILSASAGFEFHSHIENSILQKICASIYLLTPNLNEYKQLFGSIPSHEITAQYSCNILLKGGHGDSDTSTDLLIEQGFPVRELTQPRSKLNKHGTGCVLSSAIAANLARNMGLYGACEAAQAYVFGFIESGEGLLGFSKS